MKDQLLLLLELQKIDSRVRELQIEMEALPQKIAPAQKDLAKLETMIQQEKDQLAETEAWRKEQESLIQLEEEAIRKAKAKMQASRSGKDYSAASRELDNKRRSKSEREDEVLKVMEALESSRANVDSHEKDVGGLREQLEAEQARIRVRIEELGNEITERSSGRDELVAQVDAKFMKRYEGVRKKRGNAMAPVVDGICMGCHMAVPPQLNNVLARFDSLENCPRCARLLYRPDFLEDAAE